MRHLVSILGLALSLSSCAHLESTVSQGGDAPLNELPFAAEIPLARGLDANGDGAITPQDAEWFAKLSDALVDAEKVGALHYAGLKEPRKVWETVGFGQPAPLVAALATLSPDERYGLKVDAHYAARSLKTLASDSRDLSLPISGLALRGRFVANQDVVEMNALCSELETFIPSGDLPNPNERWTAVFDLDDTVWAGHVMDLGILAIAHGGLWPSNALDDIASELGLQARGDVIALAEEWVSRMRLPYGHDSLVSRKDGFFALVKAMKDLERASVRDAVSKAFTVKLGSEAPWESRFLGNHGCTLRRWMDLWRQAGGDVLLVSATPDVFVEAAQVHLGQAPGTPYRGSQLKTIDGVFDGTLEQSIYGTKDAVIREALGRSPLMVFGDSVNSDGPMYEVNFGWSFHINPGAKFPGWDVTRGGVVRTLILPQEMTPQMEAKLSGAVK